MLTSSFRRSLLAVPALSLLPLTACGTKPDGTPDGVDPTKTDAGQHKEVATDSARRPPDATGMPKGAEVQNITGAAKAGTPALASQPQ